MNKVVLFLIITIMQKNLLELKYVPATRLFQRYKAMNANTVTASNGPTMKNHCRVVLSGKNKNLIRDCIGQLKTKDPKQNMFVFC